MEIQELIEKGLEAVPAVANTVTTCVNTHAEIYKLRKQYGGISRRQKKNIEREIETYDMVNEFFIKLLENNPGLKYEIKVGNFHVSNITKVLMEAKSITTNEDKCQPVDNIDGDWLKRFFDVAGETSEEEKQKLLARVLLGELHKPESISYRTLRVLKDLTKDEINLFKKFLKISLNSSNQLFIIKENNSQEYNYKDIMALREAGLLSDESFLILPIMDKNFFTSFDLKLLLFAKANNKKLEVYAFTSSANELSKFISDNNSDIEIYKKIIKNRASNDVDFEMYKITKVNGESLSYDDEKDLLKEKTND